MTSQTQDRQEGRTQDRDGPQPGAGSGQDAEPRSWPSGRTVTRLWRRHRWWAGRIAVLPLHLLGFAVGAFFLVRAIPGDPARLVVGPEASQEEYLATRHELGFDGSLFTQLITYLNRLAHLDAGNAIMTGRPVADEIADRLPGTFELAAVAFTVIVVFSLVASFVAMWRPRSVVSRTVRAYAQAAGAIPEFVVGVLFIYVFYALLHVVPAPTGRLRAGLSAPDPLTHLPLLDSILRGRFDATSSQMSHLLGPVAVLTLSVAPLLLKQLISALDESFTAPVTRFKVAAGASTLSVVVSAYRRALPPAVALCGTVFGALLGGAVILESLFGLGGMGTYAVDAVDSKDLVALQGFLLVVAAVSLCVFLLVDLVNMALDPRRKPGVQGVQG